MDTRRRTPKRTLRPPIVKRRTMYEGLEFRALNQSLTLRNQRSWNEAGRDKLLLYNLHYFDDLMAEAATGRLDLHKKLISLWIEQNPAPSGNGWEPYPLSLRIVNWIKWHLAHGSLNDPAVRALWVQARILEQSIEYHLDANHLLTNLKALYFAGAFFEGPRSDRWLSIGMSGIGREIDNQLLCDGGHIERSPMYHAIVLEDLLDVANLAQSLNVPKPTGLDAAIVRMLQWQESMLHPDGSIPHFNDTVDGVAPDAEQIRAYAGRLGIPNGAAGPHSTCRLEGSGYVRMQNERMLALIDAGEIGPDYQPAHAHCDTLSFELSIDGCRTIVNRGISTYNASALRHSERGTSSHNTVAIDSSEQSEIWAAFRVGRRARPVNVDFSDGRLFAAHDGWKHIGIQHSREFSLDDGGLRIVDTIKGPLDSPAVANLHFYPDITIDTIANGIRVGGSEILFDGAKDVIEEQYLYCRGFGDTVPATALRIWFEESLETRILHGRSVQA